MSCHDAFTTNTKTTVYGLWQARSRAAEPSVSRTCEILPTCEAVDVACEEMMKKKTCRSRSDHDPEAGYICTKLLGHKGDHAVHGPTGDMIVGWSDANPFTNVFGFPVKNHPDKHSQK